MGGCCALQDIAKRNAPGMIIAGIVTAFMLLL